MSGFKKATCVLVALVIASSVTATASAGLLGTGHSYVDGQIWEGYQTFSGTVTGGTLAGTLDYAVFTPSEFTFLYGNDEYTPTPGELVYTYQIHNTGSVNITISKLLLLSGAPADNAGAFEGSGVSGQYPYLSTVNLGLNVTWDFTNGHNIVPPGDSAGLAFSSIRKPMNRDIDVIVDGGKACNVRDVIGPGTVSIPEPSSLVLLTAAAAVAGLVVARKRRK